MLDHLRQRLAAEPDPRQRIDLIDAALRPPEPQLLDTCVLQNLDWIHRQIEINGSVVQNDAEMLKLARRYGTELVKDLQALHTMYQHHEHHSGYPWLVCIAAVEEAKLLGGAKGESLRQLIEFLAGHQADWSIEAYPGIAQGLLLTNKVRRVSPLILRALGVKSIDDVHQAHGPLSFLPNRGDRLMAAYALLSNIPVLVTTDRKTFWAHRERIANLGLQVMRPVELLQCYEPYWEELDAEFARRRANDARS